MSSIADRVRIAQDKDGMLRRALERIIQLYTDKSHFVYELLQNAEDAEAKSILFAQYTDRLEVFHDGRPFTSQNLQGLCDIGKSDKADNLNQIGEFGVGFKSVFGICDTVRLYSVPEYYRDSDIGDAVPFAIEIKDFTRPEDIPEEVMPKGYTTRFVFPYTVGRPFSGYSDINALNKALSRKLQNLGITTLLFMKNLETIEYEIRTEGEPIFGEYLLEKEVLNDHCQLVSAVGNSEGGNSGDSEEIISYLKFSRKLAKYPQRTVDIAFPIKVEDGAYECVKSSSPYVSVYFPTETESKLNFIVQGPYRTTPNRSSIPADDLDNIHLARQTATLLRDSLVELRDAGKLNMSFVRILPIDVEAFDTFGLFAPLYDSVLQLFRSNAMIPSKSGQYVLPQYAKITRQERLANVFTDDLLTQLINDGGSYHWLHTYLTETNKEYKHVLDYFTGELGISVIRPEDLRIFFANNPKFLPAQSDDWLVELYGIYEYIPGVFSKTRNEANMTTAEIVKTSAGKFVAPFRKEGKTYIPNVFLPSSKIHSTDINFVDSVIYERCRHFFDNILQLQKPNEYEFLIRDIKKRYEQGYIYPDDQHIDDIKMLVKYVKREEYTEEVSRIIKEILAVKCTDGKMRSTYLNRIYLPVSAEGINNEAYYRNLGQKVYFVDVDFYSNHDINTDTLVSLGIRNSIVIGDNIQTGLYETGGKKQPTWWTTGEFRWKFSTDALKEVLKYISSHPTANDTILKSQAIMKILLMNENRLSGYVHVNGLYVSNLEDEPCEMIHILRGERMLGWDGKWVFTESGELVAPKSISKHNISTAIYGRLKPESKVYSLLGFKKTEADEVDELKKTIPQDKLEAYFESELKQRYGISSADLYEKFGTTASHDGDDTEEESLPFPSLRVKNWDALKKHAAEMLIYADPVRYEARVRSIRVSNHPREAKAYLSNMYRHEGVNRFKFSCQMCHEACSSFEATEVFLKPETELDPVNLCLCPNCAAQYRIIRSDAERMKKIRNVFLDSKENEIENRDHVAISIDDDDELWFTQTHFAEIRELLKLAEEVKTSSPNTPTQGSPDDEHEKSGMSVYESLVGKTIKRKDGFVGKITGITTIGKDTYLLVDVTGGKDAGQPKKIELSFILKKTGVYTIS